MIEWSIMIFFSSARLMSIKHKIFFFLLKINFTKIVKNDVKFVFVPIDVQVWDMMFTHYVL